MRDRGVRNRRRKRQPDRTEYRYSASPASFAVPTCGSQEEKHDHGNDRSDDQQQRFVPAVTFAVAIVVTIVVTGAALVVIVIFVVIVVSVIGHRWQRNEKWRLYMALICGHGFLS